MHQLPVILDQLWLSQTRTGKSHIINNLISSFSKSSLFKMFSVHKENHVVKFLRFKHFRVDSGPKLKNKAASVQIPLA